MIADFVKGKQILTFPAEIQRGIRLHRALDEYTDGHPATRRARGFFQPSCGLYGGVFMDLVYDHYLANDPAHFNQRSLSTFAEDTYHILDLHYELLPTVFRQVFSFMRTQNWLYYYHQKDGIYKSFSGVVRRAKYFPHTVEVPYNVFETYYAELEACYLAFFPDALAFMQERIQKES